MVQFLPVPSLPCLLSRALSQWLAAVGRALWLHSTASQPLVQPEPWGKPRVAAIIGPWG